jgi:hypothetical protein
MEIMEEIHRISLHDRPTLTKENNGEAIWTRRFVYLHTQQGMKNLLLLKWSLQPNRFG